MKQYEHVILDLFRLYMSVASQEDINDLEKVYETIRRLGKEGYKLVAVNDKLGYFVRSSLPEENKES